MDEHSSSGNSTTPGERHRMARTDMRRVAHAKRQLAKARDEFRASIRAAVASGETYRDVARMAGISHQRIHQIVHEHDE